MKFVSVVSMTMLLGTSLSAQVTVNSNANSFLNTSRSYLPVLGAAQVSNTRYVDLKEGSPFFQDHWIKGKIILRNGKQYHDIPVKLNLLENKVHFKDSLGKELVVTAPINELKLLQTDKSDIHFINGNILPVQKQGWFLLLVNDTVTLLKGFKKSFEEHTSYGSPTEFSIKTVEAYIAYLGKQEFEVKKASDFSNLIPPQKLIIENEIKKLGKMPREDQMTKIAIFCNDLLKKQ